MFSSVTLTTCITPVSKKLFIIPLYTRADMKLNQKVIRNNLGKGIFRSLLKRKRRKRIRKTNKCIRICIFRLKNERERLYK